MARSNKEKARRAEELEGLRAVLRQMYPLMQPGIAYDCSSIIGLLKENSIEYQYFDATRLFRACKNEPELVHQWSFTGNVRVVYWLRSGDIPPFQELNTENFFTELKKRRGKTLTTTMIGKIVREIHDCGNRIVVDAYIKAAIAHGMLIDGVSNGLPSTSSYTVCCGDRSSSLKFKDWEKVLLGRAKYQTRFSFRSIAGICGFGSVDTEIHRFISYVLDTGVGTLYQDGNEKIVVVKRGLKNGLHH
ncbi:MAG: hypothetical protein ACRC62_15805 [Microcoleus sp.]